MIKYCKGVLLLLTIAQTINIMLKGNARSLNKLMRLHFLSYILQIVIITYIVTYFFLYTLVTYIVTIHTLLHTWWINNYMYHVHDMPVPANQDDTQTKRTIPIFSRVIYFMFAFELLNRIAQLHTIAWFIPYVCLHTQTCSFHCCSVEFYFIKVDIIFPSVMLMTIVLFLK